MRQSEATGGIVLNFTAFYTLIRVIGNVIEMLICCYNGNSSSRNMHEYYISQRNVYLLGARKNAVIKERINSYSSLKERKKILDPN